MTNQRFPDKPAAGERPVMDLDQFVAEITGVRQPAPEGSPEAIRLDQFVAEITGARRPASEDSPSAAELDQFVEEITGVHRSAPQGSPRDVALTEFVEIITGLREMWDSSQHPRGGYPDNPGKFSPAGGGGGGGGSGGGDARAGGHASVSGSWGGGGVKSSSDGELRPHAGPAGRQDGALAFQSPTGEEKAGEAASVKNGVPPPPEPPPAGTPERRARDNAVKAAKNKLEFEKPVNALARKQVEDTVEKMYDMGEGTVSRQLVKDLIAHQGQVEVKMKTGAAPAARPQRQIGSQPVERAKMVLSPGRSLGAEGSMGKVPAEKPPADWRGDVVVLSHEMGHAVHGLTDATYPDGTAPYARGGEKGVIRPVYGANPALENEVRKDLDVYSKKHEGAKGVPQRPSYNHIPYNKDTPVAAEEHKAVNNILRPLGRSLPPEAGQKIDKYYRVPR